MLRPAFAALLLAAASGCSDPETPTTADFDPSEIELYTELRTNGNLAQIVVTVLADGGGAEIGGGDSLLFAEKGGAPQKLGFSGSDYVGQISSTGVEFELTFARGSSKYTYALITPAPFAITPIDTPMSRASPIPIQWGPPGGTFDTWLEISGSCLQWDVTRYLTPDAETYSIQPADLALDPSTVDCELQVWITRSVTGGATPAGLGTAVAPGAQQIRSISIPTVP